MSIELACLLGVVVLAIALDALLIGRARRRAHSQGVGGVSPVLTWRHRVLPASTVTPIEVHDPPLMTILAGLALIVYAVTRFIGLNRFPIYFFTDEAVQTVPPPISFTPAGRRFGCGLAFWRDGGRADAAKHF
jgi:hypothetical protein